MKVRDITRKKFISFQRDDKLKYILKMFAKNNITSAPVFDDDEFIGIVDINEMVKFFLPKKFIFMWKKNSEMPMDEIKNIIAADMVKMPKNILNPESMVRDVIRKIAVDVDCIPVIDKQKVFVGVIRNEDLVELLLRSFVKGELSKPEGKIGIGTEIDKVLGIIKQYEWVPAKNIAKELGMSVKTVENMGEVLCDHHLIKMKYSFFGGAELGRLESERGREAISACSEKKKKKGIKHEEKKGRKAKTKGKQKRG